MNLRHRIRTWLNPEDLETRRHRGKRLVQLIGAGIVVLALPLIALAAGALVGLFIVGLEAVT